VGMEMPDAPRWPDVQSDHHDEPHPTVLPTTPNSVVWSGSHCYVLEGFPARWVGVDDHGRARSLTRTELQRRAWTLQRTLV
jgi:hypothetical protein